MYSFAALIASFRNRNYAIYTAGNCLSLIGFWMQRVAVSWLAWELSHSAFWVGAVAFAEIVPLLVVGPLFGVWADHFDRRRMAILLLALSLLQAALLFAALEMHWLTMPWLFALTLLEGSLQAAYQPVRLALIPNLVQKADLLAAAAFTAVTFNVARFLGPAIGGAVILWWSPAWAILFNGFSYLSIIAAWCYIAVPKAEPSSNPASGHLWHDLGEGCRYILHEPALRLMFGILLLLALFTRPLTYLLSAFVGAIYGGGPAVLALFTSAVGAGAVCAGLKLTMQARARGLVREILLNSLVTLVSILAFALCTTASWAAVFLFVFGYAVTICTVAAQTLVQSSTEDSMRGRVLSIWVAATRGPPAVGVLLLGWLGAHYGLVWPLIAAVALCLVGLLLLAKGRRLMRQHFENYR